MKQAEQPVSGAHVTLGLDVGRVRTGVAVSRSGVLSEPVGLLTGSLLAQADQLRALITTLGATEIVLGSGPVGTAFLDTWHQVNPSERDVITWTFVNESYTTKEAERLGRIGVRVAQSDVVAAQLILEQYLDARAVPSSRERASRRNDANC